MSKILITGSNGQLGQCIKSLVGDLVATIINPVNKKYENERYIFTTRDEFDITDGEMMEGYIKNNPDIKIIVNCAAYTNVNGAEKDTLQAFKINSVGVKNLANLSVKYNIFLIHISTDYIYGKVKPKPCEEKWFYESSIGTITNRYGVSKFSGMCELENTMENNYLMIVTSWLYSEFGKNFVKTIYNKVKNGKECSVVNTQVGSPTYGMDLAGFIIDVINNIEKYKDVRLINFSNLGVASWYDLAKVIDMWDGGDLVKPCFNEDYIRPPYSVLNTEQLIKLEGNKPYVRHWLEALNECLGKIKED